MTFRTIEEECFRFLTARGANVPQGVKNNGQKNRPVLLSKKKKVIGQKLLLGELEAKCKLY